MDTQAHTDTHTGTQNARDFLSVFPFSHGANYEGAPSGKEKTNGEKIVILFAGCHSPTPILAISITIELVSLFFLLVVLY